MTSVAKLKERARKFEQKEDWKAAIEAYRKALESEERADDAEVELPLYNRVGDLYLRLGQTDEAVTYYEAAADKYAEFGFYNNAIALCNKALRHRPNRAHIYLKLSRLSAEQGFLPDARRWVLEYSERQLKAGNEEAAFTGLEEYADMSDDPDVREVLARQLLGRDRTAEALEQLRKAYAIWTARGDASSAERVAEEVREIDPDAVLQAGSALPGAPGDESDFGDEIIASGPVSGGLEGLETHRAGPHGHDGDGASPPPLPGLESTGYDAGLAEEPEEAGEPEPLPLLDTGDDEEPAQPLPLLDGTADNDAEPTEEEAAAADMAATADERDGEAAAAVEEPAGEDERSAPADEIAARRDEPVAPAEQPTARAGDAVSEPPPDREERPPREKRGSGDPDSLDLGTGFEQEGATFGEGPLSDLTLDLDELDLSLGDISTSGEPPPEIEAEVDVEAVLTRARELVSRGLALEAVREVNILMSGDPSPATIRAGLQVVTEVVRRDPNDVTALQQRVEIASRLEDREVMASASLDLADALARLGSATKARAMYERVLDLDPENEAAREALGAPEEADEDETVDLGAVLQKMSPEEQAEAEREVEADADDPNMSAMLSQLRARSGEGARRDDAGDHYDLGLAFKEMGLVDEAIAEFQTALTGGEERLKVYEELGQCFMLKGQFNIAMKVFNRALQVPSEDPRELLGVYYHLGQCHEEVGQREQAREAYGRVLEIDDSFADVPDRVARL